MNTKHNNMSETLEELIEKTTCEMLFKPRFGPWAGKWIATSGEHMDCVGYKDGKGDTTREACMDLIEKIREHHEVVK